MAEIIELYSQIPTFSRDTSYCQKYKYPTISNSRNTQLFLSGSQCLILCNESLMGMDLVATMHISKVQNTVKIQWLVSYNNSLIKSRSNQYNSCILYKKLISYNSKMPHNFCKFLISRSGVIKLKAVLQNSQQLLNRKFGFSRNLEIVVQQVKTIAIKIFPKFLESMNLLAQNFHKSVSEKNIFLTKSDIEYITVMKYIQASIYVDQFNNLDEKDERDYRALAKLDLMPRNWKVIDPIVNLYSYNDFEYLSQSFQYSTYSISRDQLLKFKQSLQFPKIKNNRVKNDSSFVFNYVRVQNPQVVNTKPHKEGGFSRILLTYLGFYCIDTTCASLQLFDDQNQAYTGLIKKHLCIKLPKDKTHMYRVRRETKILQSSVKGLKCPYLLKYYISKQNQFVFKEILMSDAYSSPTLDQYFELNQHCLSISTKLLLFIELAQALRFLRNYKLIHMDLKPNNIFITRQCLLKVFDFGQAYHPQVCKKQQYYPGFTLPYTAPQYFKGILDNLSFKIDNFSMGVLMLNAFICRSLQVKSCKLEKQFKMCRYMQRFLFVPQQLESYCERKFLYPIFNLIIRCLDANPQRRPNPAWNIIVLRQLLLHL